MAWIWRRLLLALGHAHDRDVIHGAVLPTHVLIHPEAHGLLLVDWYRQRPRRPRHRSQDSGHQPRVRGLVSARRCWRRTLPTPAVDLEMGLRCMVYLLGGDPLTGSLPARVPAPIQTYLRGALRTSARPDRRRAALPRLRRPARRSSGASASSSRSRCRPVAERQSRPSTSQPQTRRRPIMGSGYFDPGAYDDHVRAKAASGKSTFDYSDSLTPGKRVGPPRSRPALAQHLRPEGPREPRQRRAPGLNPDRRRPRRHRHDEQRGRRDPRQPEEPLQPAAHEGVRPAPADHVHGDRRLRHHRRADV